MTTYHTINNFFNTFPAESVQLRKTDFETSTNENWFIRVEKLYAAAAQKWPWICKSLGLKVQLLYIQPTSRFHGKKVGNYLI